MMWVLVKIKLLLKDSTCRTFWDCLIHYLQMTVLNFWHVCNYYAEKLFGVRFWSLLSNCNEIDIGVS